MLKLGRCLVVLFGTLVLVVTSANVQTLSGTCVESAYAKASPPAAQSQLRSPESEGDKISIFFHGLMVGRYKNRKKRFEVGVVNGVTDHVFGVFVIESNGNLINLTPGVGHGLYEFLVVDDAGNPVKSDTSLNDVQKACFDPMNPIYAADPAMSQDYRYIPDLEGSGLHNATTDRWRKPFSHVFHVLNGRVSSKCLTDEVIKKKQRLEPDTALRDYGYVAEVVGVDITLSPGRKLILRKKGEEELVWSCLYSSGKNVESIVLQLPRSEGHRHLQDSNTQLGGYLDWACKKDTSQDKPRIQHFQYYYIYVFKVDPNVRYDLISPMPSSAGTQSVETRYKKHTIFPYRCGMVMQGKTGDDIDGSSMN